MSSKSLFNIDDLRYVEKNQEEQEFNWIENAKATTTSNGIAKIVIGNTNYEISATASPDFKQNIVNAQSLIKDGFSIIYNKDGSFLTKSIIQTKPILKTQLLDINDKEIWLVNLKNIKDPNEFQPSNLKILMAKHKNKSVTRLEQELSLEYLSEQIKNAYFLFHCSKGHNKSNLKEYFEKIYGKKPTKEEIDMVNNCIQCGLTKTKYKSMNTTQHAPNYKISGESIHVDMCEIFILDTNFYFSIVTDEKTKIMKAGVAESKSDIPQKTEDMMLDLMKTTGNQIKVVTCDKGLENRFFKKYPFIHVKYAATGNKEMNGASEVGVRKFKIIFNNIRLILPSDFVIHFIKEITHCATEINNCNFTAAINMSPIEKLFEELKNTVVIPKVSIIGVDIFFKHNHNNNTYQDYGFMVDFNATNYTIKVYSMLLNKLVEIGVNQFKIRTGKTDFLNKFMLKLKFNKCFTIQNFETTENTNIPHNLFQSFQDNFNNEWSEPREKEINGFKDNKVYKPLNTNELENLQKSGKKIVKLINWFMFTIKESGQKKVRCIHINSKEVHKNMGLPTTMIGIDGLNYFFHLASSLKNVGYKVGSVDVKCAFLTANINNIPDNKDTIFITKPHMSVYKDIITQHCSIEDYSGYCQVTKSVYGLANSPRSFEICLQEILESLNFKHVSSYEEGMFRSFYEHDKYGFIISHVDDLLILSKDVDKVYSILETKLKIKTNSNPTTFLGIGLQFNEDNISLSIEHSIMKFINSLPKEMKQFVTRKTPRTPSLSNQNLEILSQLPLQRYRTFLKNIDDPDFSENELLNFKAFTTINKKQTYGLEDETFKKIKKEYNLNLSQTMNGYLIWICRMVRIDLTFLSRLLSKFTTVIEDRVLLSWLAVISYLYQTKDSCLIKMYREHTNNINVVLTSDASEDKTDTTLSFCGYFIYMDNNLLGVGCHNLKKYAISSTQCETIGLFEGVQKISRWDYIFRWHIKTLDKIYNSKHKINIQFETDNAALMLNVKNDKYPYEIAGVKYFHNIFSQILETKKDLIVSPKTQWVSTNENSADILTKLLPKTKIIELLSTTRLRENFKLINQSNIHKNKSTFDQ